jgi:acyl-CoA dehydrogenase
MHWAMWDAMWKAQGALEGVLSNFPNRLIAAFMRRFVFPLGRPYEVPSDKLGHKVARLLLEPSATRDRLVAGSFVSKAADDPVTLIEQALVATLAAEPVEAKLRAAIKDRRLDAKLPPGAGIDALAARAEAQGIVTAAEVQAIATARELTAKVIRVDDFPQDLGTSGLRPLEYGRAAVEASNSSIVDQVAA